MDQFLSSISRMREGTRRRCSSYDRTGGNRDYLVLAPGQNRCFCELEGGRKSYPYLDDCGAQLPGGSGVFDAQTGAADVLGW